MLLFNILNPVKLCNSIKEHSVTFPMTGIGEKLQGIEECKVAHKAPPSTCQL